MKTTKKIDKMETFKVGQRFYYKGDMANGDSFGTIVNVITRKFGTQYEVEYDQERFEDDSKKGTVEKFSFGGDTARFITLEQFNQERIENLTAHGFNISQIELAK